VLNYSEPLHSKFCIACHAGQFSKIDASPHQYSSNGDYYAVFKNRGKLIWKNGLA